MRFGDREQRDYGDPALEGGWARYRLGGQTGPSNRFLENDEHIDPRWSEEIPYDEAYGPPDPHRRPLADEWRFDADLAIIDAGVALTQLFRRSRTGFATAEAERHASAARAERRLELEDRPSPRERAEAAVRRVAARKARGYDWPSTVPQAQATVTPIRPTVPLERPRGDTRLHLWRVQQGYTRDEVAGLCGIHPVVIALAEQGEIALSPRMKVHISRCVGARIAELFDAEEIFGGRVAVFTSEMRLDRGNTRNMH